MLSTRQVSDGHSKVSSTLGMQVFGVRRTVFTVLLVLPIAGHYCWDPWPVPRRLP